MRIRRLRLSRLFSALVDYDEALRNLNQYFDRFVQISQLPYWERKEALKTMRQEFRLTAVDTLTTAQLLFQSPEERGEMFAQQVFNQFAVLDHTTIAQDRSRMKRELVSVVLGIELYQRTHGRYPEELSQLVPAQLPAIPSDRFTGEPLSYQMKEGEYCVECTGYRPLARDDSQRMKITSPGWVD